MHGNASCDSTVHHSRPTATIFSGGQAEILRVFNFAILSVSRSLGKVYERERIQGLQCQAYLLIVVYSVLDNIDNPAT